jgi:hypothetical protein
LTIDGYEQIKPEADRESKDTRLLGIGIAFIRVTSVRR